MTTVACVLWSGGDFGPEWVRALHRGVSEHLPEPHRFVCITSEDVPCDSIEPVTDWHTYTGWWGKLEVFRPDIPGDHILYMDLDSLPVGDLTEIASWRGDFGGMRDVYTPARLQASILSFTKGGTAARLYKEFTEHGPEIRSKWRGDQWWFTDVVPDATRLQDEVDGIYSYKVSCRHGAPGDAALVVGHGRPRFSSPDARWAHDLWRERAQ